MVFDADVIVVGAGLAGASAALALSGSRRVLVLEAASPAAGASGAAAGLINPLMGRRARPAWRHEAALDALQALLDAASAGHLFRAGGLLRPARDAAQAERFHAAAAALPDLARFLSAPACAERFAAVEAPHGALEVLRGGALDVGRLVEACLRAAARQGARLESGTRLTRWHESREGVVLETSAGERAAPAVILALGAGYVHHAALQGLPLHRIKGQLARLARPPGLPDLPPLAGAGYVVPDGETLLVGTSYAHDFEDLTPDPAVTRSILAKAAAMLPALAGAVPLEETAGVRVTVPRVRLPLLGPLPGHRRTWVFTGLGSKGLLTAPMLARHLPAYLEAPSLLPPEVRPPG